MVNETWSWEKNFHSEPHVHILSMGMQDKEIVQCFFINDTHDASKTLGLLLSTLGTSNSHAPFNFDSPTEWSNWNQNSHKLLVLQHRAFLDFFVQFRSITKPIIIREWKCEKGECIQWTREFVREDKLRTSTFVS